MRVLVACECSGTVRDAFLDRGHDAWSCDLADDYSDTHPERHIVGDCLPLLKQSNGLKWNLIIAHPPCTYLCSSGEHWNRKNKYRAALVQPALDFFKQFLIAPCFRIAVENPPGLVNTVFRKPEQTIQPWMFGHDESKRTSLWLKNLPLLKPTDVVERPKGQRYANQTATGRNIHIWITDKEERARVRSKTYEGIAQAMASQWGNLEAI